MKFIRLTQGKIAMVDDEDFEWLSESSWHYSKSNKEDRYGYAKRPGTGKTALDRMHRVIMKARDGVDVDHVDGNGINNQKSNLRICTKHQNRFNTKIPSANTSGFKGVGFHKKARKWRARVKLNGKENHIGLFVDKIEAAKAYDELATKLFGKFARTNKDEGLYV
jgi:hypothetical protein